MVFRCVELARTLAIDLRFQGVFAKLLHVTYSVLMSPSFESVVWPIKGPYKVMKDHHAIGRVRSGAMLWRVGWRLIAARPGTLLLGQPGDVHQKLEGEGIIEVVKFSQDVFDGQRWPRHVADGAALHALFNAINAQADALHLEVALTEAVNSLRGEIDVSNFTQPVQRALELLAPGNAVTLDALAAHAGVDKFRLCRAFRTQVGMPPHTYLTHLRVMRVKRLLREGARPGEAAARAGFYDQSQLNRHFRRIVGATPSEFAGRSCKNRQA